jgi:hypothetical protein
MIVSVRRGPTLTRWMGTPAPSSRNRMYFLAFVGS